MKTWVVIPAYNEASVIGRVIADVRAVGPNVVVVDDASTDGTGQVARQIGVPVIEHIINRGQGAALKTGIRYALEHGADIIVTFDSDGQHQATDIARLVAPVESGQADVVLGSRFITNGSNVPPLRRLVLKFGVWFTRLVSRIKVTDTHNGLRAMNRQAAQKIRLVQDRMAHASEILDEIVRHRLRYTEAPVTVTYNYYSRAKGQSSGAMFRIAFKFLISKLMH